MRLIKSIVLKRKSWSFRSLVLVSLAQLENLMEEEFFPFSCSKKLFSCSKLNFMKLQLKRAANILQITPINYFRFLLLCYWCIGGRERESLLHNPHHLIGRKRRELLNFKNIYFLSPITFPSFLRADFMAFQQSAVKKWRKIK